MSKILIVDDDPDFQSVYAMALEKEGYEVASALTPEEAIEKVRSEKPDLVILDIMIPSGYEGFEVAQTIREEMKLIELPIIVISNVHERKKIPYRFAPDQTYLPVDIWIDKPVRPEIVLEAIRGALSEFPQQPG